MRAFTARHFLVGGDWGPENKEHAHNYKLEWEIRGDKLDTHGYLVDLVAMEAILDAAVARYAGKVLNDFDSFSGINPSLERFAALLCETLAVDLLKAGESVPLHACSVKLWEHDQAWAAFEISEREYETLRKNLRDSATKIA